MSKVLSTADWHIRSTVPSCLDMTQQEWMDLQKLALTQIVDMAIKHDVSGVYCGGDLFHSEPTTSFECIQMVQWVADQLSNNMIEFRIICGNHDLPMHSSENIYRAAIGAIINSKYVQMMNDETSLIHGCNFDEDNYDGYERIFKHVLCMPENDKPDIVECETPQTLLKKFPNAKYIYLGDYHKRFHYQSADGRHVINSGCLTKQAADFEDYENGVWITDFDTNEVIWESICCDYRFNHNGVVKKNLDEKIENFANSIKKESVTLDFISSVKTELQNHEKPVQEKVESWIKEIGQ